MKLVVHELQAEGLIQELTPSKNTLVEAVRPHIYRHNWPTGSLQMQILNSEDEVIAESNIVNISEIGEANFFHGYVRFLIDVGLKKNQTYKFKLVGADGYAFNESSYCGICSDFDFKKYDASYSPSGGLRSPLDIEVWARSTR